MDLATLLVLIGLIYLALAPLVALILAVFNWARLARLESDVHYLKSNLCDCSCGRDVPYIPSGSTPDPEHDVPIRVEDGNPPATSGDHTITPSAKTPLSSEIHP